MTKILYAGHTIVMPDGLDVDEFVLALQDSYAKDGHAWVTFDYADDPSKQVRLLFGPGIPVGFVSDQAADHDGVGVQGTPGPLIEPLHGSVG